jgi:hypothetical protein
MHENDDNILGCFISHPANYSDTDADTVAIRRGKAEIFAEYVWGEFGIRDPLTSLKRSDYGKDLKLALFQFYVLPIIEELAYLKEIERYRPKERAIGIPIIVHDYNFFSKSDLERRRFLRQAILDKLELLAHVIKRNKLDTNLELLKSDVARVLS